MIRIDDKQKCAGCSACMVVCPKQAISMAADEQGFLYPSVDSEKCVNCGACNQVCPWNKPLKKTERISTFAVKHKDPQVLQESTSGGFFTAISDYVLSQDGAVYGAVLDEKKVVRHVRATTSEERDRMRGSKYVQSDVGDVFIQIKNDLKNNRMVLFTGTPCQVAGLRGFLKGNCDGLICVDLICHGVPSPMIFAEHMRFLGQKHNTKIVDYKFRPKKWGWHVHREVLCGEKRIYHSTPYTDLWKELYYSRIITRPSCNNCRFSNLNRAGDISIGDCRGIDNVAPGFGSYEGVSLAIINTQTGRKMFEKIADTITFLPLNIEDVMQPPLRQSGQPNKFSEQFFSYYRKHGYKKTIIFRYGRLYPLKYYIKKWMYRK